MPSTQVESSATLTAGIRDDFWDTYESTYEGVEKLLSPLVEFVPSTRRSEEYGFYESAPHPRQWKRGKPASAEGFGSDAFSVANKDWEVGVGWHRWLPHQNESLWGHERMLVGRRAAAGLRGWRGGGLFGTPGSGGPRRAPGSTRWRAGQKKGGPSAEALDPRRQTMVFASMGSSRSRRSSGGSSSGSGGSSVCSRGARTRP